MISLPDKSFTLDLLFQFIYPLRRPDLKPLKFDTVRLLTICAEQYGVYAARVICKEYMRSGSRMVLWTRCLSFDSKRETLPQEARFILIYAAKHRYYDILDVATPLVIDQPLKHILADMPKDCILPWVNTICSL